MARDEIFQEWCEFHLTRRAVTILRHAGRSTSDALSHLLLASGLLAKTRARLNIAIIQGLQMMYATPNSWCIYDPGFDDPAVHIAIHLEHRVLGQLILFFVYPLVEL